MIDDSAFDNKSLLDDDSKNDCEKEGQHCTHTHTHTHTATHTHTHTHTATHTHTHSLICIRVPTLMTTFLFPHEVSDAVENGDLELVKVSRIGKKNRAPTSKASIISD